MSIRRLITPSVAILAAVAAGAIVAAAIFASLAFGTDSGTKAVAVKPCGDRDRKSVV